MISNELAILCALFFLVAVFGVLSSVRFDPGIAGYAVGSLLLAGYACCIAVRTGYFHLWVVAGLTVLVKALAIPWILSRLVRALPVRAEGRPGVGVPTSLLAGAVLTIIAYTAGTHLLPSLGSPYHQGLAAGLSVMLIGMAVIAMRRQAVIQLLGLLLCENGALMIGLAVVPSMQLIIEFGVALDIIIAVMIFARLVIYLHEVVQTTDTAELRYLRG